MRRLRLGRLVTTATAVAIAVVALLPVAARAEPIDDARNQIWSIVRAADSYNQSVLNQFASAATSASSVSELDTAFSIGYNALEARWYQANAEIDAIVELFPSLVGEASAAKAALLDDHNGAHAEMDALYDVVWENLVNPPTTTTTTTTTVPPTTSTSTTSTTTSTTSTTTTTVPGSSTTTTTVPRSSTTTPGSTTTTAVTTTTLRDASTTTTTIGGFGIGDTDPGSGDELGARVGDDPAAASEPAFGSAEAAGTSLDGAMSESMQDSAPAMAMIVETFSIVLPPGIVEMAARPLIAIEFIVRTFFDSVGAMVLPFLTLMAAVAFMLWRESRRVRLVGG